MVSGGGCDGWICAGCWMLDAGCWMLEEGRGQGGKEGGGGKGGGGNEIHGVISVEWLEMMCTCVMYLEILYDVYICILKYCMCGVGRRLW